MKELAIAHARSLIGTKWRHLGRSERGVDCLGLLVLSLRAAGIEVQDRAKYSREPWKDGLREALREHFGEPVSDWQPGDIALMRWHKEQEPAHVGILANYQFGGLSLIHAYSLIAVTEHRLDEDWSRAIVEVYRPW